MGELELTSVLRPAPSILTREIDGEIVAFVSATGLAHMLNPSASLIWRRFDGTTSTGEIARRLADETGAATEIVAADVMATAAHLLELGLVLPADAPA